MIIQECKTTNDDIERVRRLIAAHPAPYQAFQGIVQALELAQRKRLA